MATQRYYERGVGSRTGMRPAAIPADPSAMRAEMESLFRQRQPPQPSSASAMDTAPPSDTPSAAVQRSVERRRHRDQPELERAPADSADENTADPSDASFPLDEPVEAEETEENEPPAPRSERRRNPVLGRPASLFTSIAPATKRRQPQPGNYSWLAEVEDDEDDEDDEQVASSLGLPKEAPVSNPPGFASRSRPRTGPRPRAAQPGQAPSPARAAPARRTRPETESEQEDSPPAKRKAPAREREREREREPAPSTQRARAKKSAPSKSTARQPKPVGRPRKHVPSPSPPPSQSPLTEPELEPEPEPEPQEAGPSSDGEADEEPVPRKRPGRPPNQAAPKAAKAAKAGGKKPAAAGGVSRGNGKTGRGRSQPAPGASGVEESVSPPVRDASAEAEGLRRSTRHRIKPLEWWRGERAEYGRPSLGKGDVPGVPGPTLRKVYRVNRAEGEGTFSGLHFKRGKKGRAPTRRATPTASGAGRARRDGRDANLVEGEAEDDDGYVELDPTADNVAVEDGMDEATERVQVVWDPDQNEEVERTIACTSMQMNPRTLEGQSYGFEKLLSADDTMAAGVLSVPVGGSKPTKSSKDNNYVFVVIQGAALVKVGRSEFTIAPGGMFLVPRGNTYSIENAAQRELRLFFTQSRNGHAASMALRASVQPQRRGTATPAPTALLQHALGPRVSTSSIPGQTTPVNANGARRR